VGVIESFLHSNNGIRISEFGLGFTGIQTQCELRAVRDTGRKWL